MAKNTETGSSEVEVLTADEVSRWLRIPKSTLYKLCHEAQIPATKIGRHWRFERATVNAWLRKKMMRSETEGTR